MACAVDSWKFDIKGFRMKWGYRLDSLNPENFSLHSWNEPTATNIQGVTMGLNDQKAYHPLLAAFPPYHRFVVHDIIYAKFITANSRFVMVAFYGADPTLFVAHELAIFSEY
jgi:hypothetical protein